MIQEPVKEGYAVSDAPILSIRGLCKSFGGFHAVKDVDVDFQRGQIHALIGPNGAGKSTFFSLLSKFHEPTSGTISLAGQDITRTRPEKVVRMGMVRSFQISAVFPEMTVFENVRVALQRRTGRDIQFWCGLGLLDGLRDEAMYLLDRVGIADLADKRAADLSYGRKRTLEIATTLALDPKVILLDEPMAGMAVEDIGMVSALIKEISHDRTTLMVEHNLNVVEDLCDTATVLARGEIVAKGTFSEIRNDSEVRRAYIGTDYD